MENEKKTEFNPPYEVAEGADQNRPGDHNHPENWTTPPEESEEKE